MFSKILVFIALVSSLVYSQTAATSVVASKDTSVYVVSAQNYSSGKNTVGLEDYVSLKVNNLNKLVEGTTVPLTLYFNGMPMLGIVPLFVDTVQNTAVFQLSKSDTKVWEVFYHKTSRKAVIPVDVSIGSSDKGSIKGSQNKIMFKLYNRYLLWGMLAIYVLILLGFGLLAKKSIIVRDGFLIGDNRATFSLAKSQLAFWTLIIVGSVGYIFAVTGSLPVITGSTLVLLAVSIGTAVGAKLINGSKDTIVVKESKSFFIDILSDEDGVSIHRFQMVVWTIFIGIYFIYSVFNGLDIPHISKELLALMGISSGTYLGLKIPEDKKTKEEDKREVVIDTPEKQG